MEMQVSGEGGVWGGSLEEIRWDNAPEKSLKTLEFLYKCQVMLVY